MSDTEIQDDVPGRGERSAVASVQAARQRVSELANRLRRAGSRVSDRTREGYGATVRGLAQGARRVTRDVATAHGTVGTYVRDNPGKAVLMAAAAGFLVGLVLRDGGRRDDGD